MVIITFLYYIPILWTRLSYFSLKRLTYQCIRLAKLTPPRWPLLIKNVN